jgi:hypothetical protein
MKKALLALCCYASTIMCLTFVGLFVFARIADPHIHIDKSHVSYPHLSLSKNVNITLTKDWGGYVIIFTQNVPYMGSMFALTGEQSVREKVWGFYGVDFLLIKDATKEDSWWTLMLSLWYPIIIFGVLPTVFAVKKVRATRVE